MALVKTTQVNLECDEVTNVVVTSIEQDLEAGDYVRVIRVFGTPPAGATTAPMLMEIKIRAATQQPLQIDSPQSVF